MNYVNHLGEPVSLDRLSFEASQRPKRQKKEQPESFHNGWRVQGIPPGELESARDLHQREAAFAREQGKQPKDWDQQHWLMNAKRKAVRTKPYEVPAAAEECKRMAEKAGWLQVEIVELKKEAAKAC